MASESDLQKMNAVVKGKKTKVTVLGEWKEYKRYADGVKLQGRLVELEGTKYIEVKEDRMPIFTCPHCSTPLTEVGGDKLPRFLLRPEVFHTRHKPLDKS